LGTFVYNYDGLDVFQVLDFRFTIPPPAVRDLLSKHVRGKRGLRAMYLGSIILQGLNRDIQKHDTAIKKYIGLVERLEKRFTIDFRGSLPLNDIRDCLGAHIEVNSLST
jgi:hypothetical protein